MAHADVTPQTIGRIRRVLVVHQRGHFAMTTQAVLLRNSLVKIGDANRFVEIAGRECITVS